MRLPRNDLDEPDANRTVRIAPERLAGWLARFEDSHGEVTAAALGADVMLTSPDGAQARMIEQWSDDPLPSEQPLDAFLSRQLRTRTFGLLLARRGAHGIGIAQGEQLLVHRIDTHYVQGRTKAGGWSQQRYARRRANQTTAAWESAARDAAELLLPHAAELEALICGGDKPLISAILAEPDLAPLAALRTIQGLPGLAEPRLVVLQKAAAMAREVPIELNAQAGVRS